MQANRRNRFSFPFLRRVVCFLLPFAPNVAFLRVLHGSKCYKMWKTVVEMWITSLIFVDNYPVFPIRSRPSRPFGLPFSPPKTVFDFSFFPSFHALKKPSFAFGEHKSASSGRRNGRFTVFLLSPFGKTQRNGVLSKRNGASSGFEKGVKKIRKKKNERNASPY